MFVNTEKKWFSRKEASAFLTSMGCAISPRTLQKLAVHNNSLKGPPFTRSGWKSVRYERNDLEEWARSQIVKIK
jgi:hypothetical protein